MDEAVFTAATPRRSNATTILRIAWEGAAITAADLMAATSLTRSTVIGLCDELVDTGWLRELPNARTAGSDYHKGRPARRYELRADAGVVIGLDAGPHRFRATVADLRGAVLGSSSRAADPTMAAGGERLGLAEAVIGEALATAGVDAADVLCLTVGVSAPVDGQGISPQTTVDFWQRMNPGFAHHFAARGWATVVENDANLAAVAEGAWGAGRGCGSYVTLVSGERFGAGYVLDGQLVRGASGGAGELHLLDLVEGVGSADGLGAVARQWAREARASEAPGTPGVLAGLDSEQINAEQVFDAARQGDALAVDIADRLAARLARICAVLAGLLDVERIIVAGAVAPALDLLLEQTCRKLGELMHTPPPEIVASTLGDKVVGAGAVVRSLQYVRDHALDMRPASSGGR
ncbi:ROK family protein [Arthrobacter sp.]|uniref:ROK family protein n=1 Tax=Arthrobacter sp. TaxID=1667 RepID=UPI003A9202C3